MKPLESLWQETKQKFDKLEKALVNDYIAFLREVAKIYIEQSRRVFFRENQFVHWGEWNFGSLLIEGDEEVDAVFGGYISEIRFEPEINEKITEGYIEIKKGNIDDISYQML
jgi:hypothetical protein